MDRINISEYNKLNLTLWFFLSFQAGVINAGGFLSCHRFVTHTTGFATQFGTEFAKGDLQKALGMLTVPLFFLGGTMISAYFVDRRISKFQKPNYTFLAGLMALLFFILVFLGEIGFLGDFGHPPDLQIEYFILATLCLASGIQNAAITSASGAVIRTTHLTGLTTDLGIGLIRIFSNPTAYRFEKKATLIRSTLIGGFILGSTMGAFSFFHMAFRGFWIPALISTIFLALELFR